MTHDKATALLVRLQTALMALRAAIEVGADSGMMGELRTTAARVARAIGACERALARPEAVPKQPPNRGAPNARHTSARRTGDPGRS